VGGGSTSAFDPERTLRLSIKEGNLASRPHFLWKQTMIDELQKSWDVLFPRQTHHRAVPRSFIPVGIRIGLDAAEKLRADPRGLLVTYYSGPSRPFFSVF
jgi:hypothetical protein